MIKICGRSSAGLSKLRIGRAASCQGVPFRFAAGLVDVGAGLLAVGAELLFLAVVPLAILLGDLHILASLMGCSHIASIQVQHCFPIGNTLPQT